MHIDHAGGLEHLLDSGVSIITHEEEFKHACWAVATGADLGVYIGHYMVLKRQKWQNFTEPNYQIYQGMTLHHSPGHTPGLCALQINLQKERLTSTMSRKTSLMRIHKAGLLGITPSGFAVTG